MIRKPKKPSLYQRALALPCRKCHARRGKKCWSLLRQAKIHNGLHPERYERVRD